MSDLGALTDHEQVGIVRRGAPRFAMVPEWVLLHPDATDRAVRVWCHLWLRSDWSTGRATVSIARLADDMGRSRSAVRGALADLVAIGALNVVAEERPSGASGWNRYELAFDPPPPAVDNPVENPQVGGVANSDPSPVAAGGGSELWRGGVANSGPLFRGTTQKEEEVEVAAEPIVEHRDDVDDAIRGWLAIKGVPVTPALLDRWRERVAAWIDGGGRVDPAFLADAHRQGYATPDGWPWAAMNRDTRWDRIGISDGDLGTDPR